MVRVLPLNRPTVSALRSERSPANVARSTLCGLLVPIALVQEQRIKPGTKARELYGKDVVGERHRHRYEFNNRYRTQLEDAGLVISAKSMDDLLVEMIELPDHPWFIACQAHPEFLSTPRTGHPLFIGFVRAAREQKAGGKLLKEAKA